MSTTTEIRPPDVDPATGGRWHGPELALVRKHWEALKTPAHPLVITYRSRADYVSVYVLFQNTLGVWSLHRYSRRWDNDAKAAWWVCDVLAGSDRQDEVFAALSDQFQEFYPRYSEAGEEA